MPPTTTRSSTPAATAEAGGTGTATSNGPVGDATNDVAGIGPIEAIS